MGQDLKAGKGLHQELLFARVLRKEADGPPASMRPASISNTVPRVFLTPLYSKAVALLVVADIRPNSTAKGQVGMRSNGEERLRGSELESFRYDWREEGGGGVKC